jgi:hypothetical protein
MTELIECEDHAVILTAEICAKWVYTQEVKQWNRNSTFWLFYSIHKRQCKQKTAISVETWVLYSP